MPASAGPAPPVRVATGTSTRRPSLYRAVISRATSSADGEGVAAPAVSVVRVICRTSRARRGPGPAEELAGTDVHHRKHSGRQGCLSIGSSTTAQAGGGILPRGGVRTGRPLRFVGVLDHLAGVEVEEHRTDRVRHAPVLVVGDR